LQDSPIGRTALGGEISGFRTQICHLALAGFRRRVTPPVISK